MARCCCLSPEYQHGHLLLKDVEHACNIQLVLSLCGELKKKTDLDTALKSGWEINIYKSMLVWLIWCQIIITKKKKKKNLCFIYFSAVILMFIWWAGIFFVLMMMINTEIWLVQSLKVVFFFSISAADRKVWTQDSRGGWCCSLPSVTPVQSKLSHHPLVF